MVMKVCTNDVPEEAENIATCLSFCRKTEGWSTKLIMQMIPKHILGSIGNTFFKNVKTVMFLPDQSPALEALTTFLFRGMVSVGCVGMF